jgi:CHRD domain
VKKLASLAVVGAAALLVTAAVAVAAALDNYKVSATLKAGSETPKPTGVKASAKGSFSGSYTESKTGGTLKWKLSFSGLTGPATAAHIHKGKPGVAGPVIVPLCGPCSSGQSGTAKISKAVIAALEGHNAYVNVHTMKNQGGEIRGAVKVTGG